MSEQIGIYSYGLLSPLGEELSDMAFSAEGQPHALGATGSVAGKPIYCLAKSSRATQNDLSQERSYRSLDPATIYALTAARSALKDKQQLSSKRLLVNIGSSRGATHTLESMHNQFRENGRSAPRSSPLTTLGNISSWVLHELAGKDRSHHIAFSHSMTCSTALGALANGLAWLHANMADLSVVGATEAPLTPFSISQMEALGIYSENHDSPHPCTPLSTLETNSFALSEGAAVFHLERIGSRSQSPLAIIRGIGFGAEPIRQMAGLSPHAECIFRSMQAALSSASLLPGEIDMVFLHAPGTCQGDGAELNAIDDLFGTNRPYLFSNKWQLGHGLAASGGFSIASALALLDGGEYPQFPYPTVLTQCVPQHRPKNILVNAVGFGGVAGSVILAGS